jgi:predicted ATPase with chaperone activity
MTHRLTRGAALAAAFGLAAAMAAAPALAQDDDTDRQAQPGQQQQQQMQKQPSQPQNTEVSDEQLEQFVDALAEISIIRQTAAVELESAVDMEQAERVHREAQEQMIEAVENAGLSVDEYNRIATLMGTDADLSQRVHSKLQERS